MIRGVSSVSNKKRHTTLFIHGLGGDSNQWQAVTDLLADVIQPIYWTLPGHGPTAHAMPEKMDQALDMLDTFLHSHSIDEPITLIGHSLGGLIALAYYLRRPALINRLALISTAAHMSIHPTLFIQLKERKIDINFLEQGFTQHLSPEIKNQLIGTMRDLDINHNVEDILELSSINYTSYLTQVRCDSLVILGTQDKIISPRRTRDLSRKMSNCKLIELDGVGHYPHLEASQNVADCINHFLMDD